MRVAFLIAGIAVLGCAEEAKAPRAQDVDVEGDTTEGLASVGDAPAKAPKEAPAEPASDEDIQAVIQLVIDDESLQQYLNLTEPGRLPLQISGDGIPTSLQLLKASQNVSIVGAPADSSAPVLVFTQLEITSRDASVLFKYGPERLRGRATLEKSDDGWELVNSSQSQY